MKIKQAICLSFLLILFWISITAQETAFNNNLVKNFKVNKNQPSVFLTFEKFGEIKPIGSSNFIKVGFLSLHNNTILPIAVDANFDTRIIKSDDIILSDGTAVRTIPDKSLIEICFDVEVIPYTTSIEVIKKSRDKKVRNGIISGIQLKDKNPAENDKTTCFWRNNWRGDDLGNGERIWIKSNHSFIFSVPVDYLKDNLKVSTLFNYEWEFNNEKLNFEEPKHRVYFYGSELPK